MNWEVAGLVVAVAVLIWLGVRFEKKGRSMFDDKDDE